MFPELKTTFLMLSTNSVVTNTKIQSLIGKTGFFATVQCFVVYYNYNHNYYYYAVNVNKQALAQEQ